MLVRGLSPASRYGHNHDVTDRRVRPRREVAQAGLLDSFAQRDQERIVLMRIGVPAHLQPCLLALVPAQQHPAAVRVNNESRRGQVQRGGAQPRIWLGPQQLTYPLKIKGFLLALRLVTREPLDDRADHSSAPSFI